MIAALHRKELHLPHDPDLLPFSSSHANSRTSSCQQQSTAVDHGRVPNYEDHETATNLNVGWKDRSWNWLSFNAYERTLVS